MKYRCLRDRFDDWITKEEKKLAKWRNWFAWYPINIDGYCFWLETVKRRDIYYYEETYPGLYISRCRTEYKEM